MLTKYLERRALLFILQHRKLHLEPTPYETMLAMLTQFLGVTDTEIREWAVRTMAVPGLKGFGQPEVRRCFIFRLLAHGLAPSSIDNPDFVTTGGHNLFPVQEKRALQWAASDPPAFHHEPYHPLTVVEHFTKEFPDLRDAAHDCRLGWIIPLSSDSVKWVVNRARTWLKDDYGVVYEEKTKHLPGDAGQLVGAISVSSTNCGPQVVVGPWSISRCKPFDREIVGAKAYDHALSPQEIADEHRTFQQAHNQMNRKPAEPFPKLYELLQASKHFGPSPWRILADRARLALAQCKRSPMQNRMLIENYLAIAETRVSAGVGDRHGRRLAGVQAEFYWENISSLSEDRWPPTLNLEECCQDMLAKIYAECGEPVSTETPNDLTGEEHLDDLHKFLAKSERLQRRG